MKSLINTLLLSFAALYSKGQLYDGTFVVGDYSLSFMNVDSNSSIDSSGYENNLFTLTVANICDEYGNLLYITNGVKIFDGNGDTIENGTGINPCSYTEQYICCGLNIQQAALFIPQPGSNRYYYLFHFTNDDTVNGGPETLYYSLIDRQGNGGSGAVIKKNIPLLQNTLLSEGGMTACKHANGRDYWLIVPYNLQSTYYKFLITPSGIIGPYTQAIGPYFTLPFDNTYSRFSQDGSKYVTGAFEGPVLVMDFDRCSGDFSNALTIFNQACNPPQSSCSGSVSVEISPNNRFIYVCDRLNLNQYDLLNSIVNDSILIYAIDSTEIAEMKMLELAPNGKIYLSSWNGLLTYDSLHVINNPNEKGDSCNFVYAGQPTYSRNNQVPNMANYRLGPLVGSGCDTITEINKIANNLQLNISPNPFIDNLNINLAQQGLTQATFTITNPIGQTIYNQTDNNLSDNYTKMLDLRYLPNGVYFIEVSVDGERICREVVKQ